MSLYNNIKNIIRMSIIWCLFIPYIIFLGISILFLNIAKSFDRLGRIVNDLMITKKEQKEQ